MLQKIVGIAIGTRVPCVRRVQYLQMNYITNPYYKPINNHYKVLGLETNANEDEIKIAYLQLIKKYHPDLNKEEGAPEKFR